MMTSKALFFIQTIASILFISCTSQVPDDAPFGVSPNKAGYIPARMALTSCMTWPERSSRMKNQPLSTATPAEMQKLCSDFDQFVAAGFENQPFMKGLSPKLVDKLYSSAGLTPSVSVAIAQQWQTKSEDCVTCITPPSFYTVSIAPRKQWNVWLAEFARATKGSDAILIPILVQYGVTHENDRGLVVAKRSAIITLLLVDTTNGDLIWSGGREAEAVSKAFKEDPRSKNLLPPDPEEMKRRLFTDAVWLGFPGRQVYK